MLVCRCPGGDKEKVCKVKFVLFTNSCSAHQLPLSREIVKQLGADNFQYVYTEDDSRHQRSQVVDADESWVTKDRSAVETCDVLLIGGLRPIDVMLRRSETGKRTLYMSERWFKPPLGMFRLLHPKYLLMAWRIVKLIRNSPSFTYLPIGIHAARDMARLCGLMHGDLRCFFRAPKLDFERKPGGRIWQENGGDNGKYCLEKMLMWGYFVEPSRQDVFPVKQLTETGRKEVRVLWVGRLLKLKRVDTIVRAVIKHANLRQAEPSLPNITLDIYGKGPEEERLKKMAHGYEDLIKFYPPVPIAEVRTLMREHDVYVLSSNAYEGWGAVVSEALEEGMKVIGTYEAGSCATILPKEHLFHAGDWRRLLRLLSMPIQAKDIENWTAKMAAKAVLI